MNFNPPNPPSPPCLPRSGLPAGEGVRSSAVPFLKGIREVLLVLVGLALVALIAVLDYWTGPYVSFGIFYLIPVAACAWWGGFSHGILLTLAGSIAWHVVDSLENPLIPAAVGIWNGITRFAVLVLTSSLVARLRAAMLREQLLARTDPLTGAVNARTFYEVVAAEAGRACRSAQPLTLAYFDLDNFKHLNDRMGHAAGDAALIRVVQSTRLNLRKSDLLARLGGDEFAVLLPDTGADVAGPLLQRIQGILSDEMACKNCPITVSVGAITFLRPAWDVDLMVQQVDALMYRAKKKGKARLELAMVKGGTDEKFPGTERRASARVLCNRPAYARPEGESQEDFVTVRDISADGVGLFLEKAIPTGTLLVVEPLTYGAKTLLAKVVRSNFEEGGWLHGCDLSTRLDEEDIRCWYNHHLVKSC
jgi:diguanylate cyclase (GGDEF)-like protein